LHVLLHTRFEAGFFAAREGSSGFGDATLEAVFIEFLASLLVRDASLGGECRVLMGWTYLDQHARILHGSFLLYLAHNLRFWVVGKGTEACAA
jgi:hypothetical protein